MVDKGLRWSFMMRLCFGGVGFFAHDDIYQSSL